MTSVHRLACLQRRGIVAGVNHGFAGFVRFVDAPAIAQQLDNGCVVLLSNLGYSAGGALLVFRYTCLELDEVTHGARRFAYLRCSC